MTAKTEKQEEDMAGDGQTQADYLAPVCNVNLCKVFMTLKTKSHRDIRAALRQVSVAIVLYSSPPPPPTPTPNTTPPPTPPPCCHALFSSHESVHVLAASCVCPCIRYTRPGSLYPHVTATLQPYNMSPCLPKCVTWNLSAISLRSIQHWFLIKMM